MDLVTSFTNEVIRKALDGTSARHGAIASNLANVDTPGYQKKQVSFEDQLQTAIEKQQGAEATTDAASNARPLGMKATRPGHLINSHTVLTLEDVQPSLTEAEDLTYRNDDNGVDVETEMVELAKNTQTYMALSNVQSRLLRSTRGVISNTSG